MKKILLILTALISNTVLLSACSSENESPVVQWPLNEQCDLHHETCSSEQHGASVKLKISPHPIPIARPLGIEVSTKNLDIASMQLDISGKSMYMGYNRVPLTEVQLNRFVGTSMLAFCTTQKMQWQITLIIDLKDGQQIQIPYQLETLNKL